MSSDLTADLLAEAARPAPLPASAPPRRSLPEHPVASGTPALAVTVTPLRWSRPALSSAQHGTGLALRVGPLRVELAF